LESHRAMFMSTFLDGLLIALRSNMTFYDKSSENMCGHNAAL
jgi:hypothetical protein